MRTSFSLGTGATSSCSEGNQIGSQYRRHARSAVMCFLDCLGDSLSHRMPHKPERHLPFIQKRQVYEQITMEFHQACNRQPPSLSYFEPIWCQCLPSINGRKYGRFQRCALCVVLEARLRHAIDTSRNKRFLKVKNVEHIQYVRMERLEYYKKTPKTNLILTCTAQLLLVARTSLRLVCPILLEN